MVEVKNVKNRNVGTSHLALITCYVIVFVASFSCYANTLSAQFVYDDSRCILRNQDLLPSTPWTNVFYNDFWGTRLSHSGSHKSYRPLCILSFRMNYMIGELNPFGYHLVNVLLHAVVSCLFTYVCFHFFRDMWVALLGGLLFSFHPVHTEAVAGLVGRADVGAAMFFLTALILYMDSVKDSTKTSYTKIVLSLLSCICSMVTKEQGFTVFAVLLAYEVLYVSKCNLTFPLQCLQQIKSSNGAVKRIFLVVLFAITALYSRFLIMGNSLPNFSPADNPAANDPVRLTRFLTFFYLPLCNFWLLLFPTNLSYDYSLVNVPLVQSIFSLEFVISVMFYVFLLSCGLIYLYFFKHLSARKVSNENRKRDINNNSPENTRPLSNKFSKRPIENTTSEDEFLFPEPNGRLLEKDKGHGSTEQSPSTYFLMASLNHMVFGLAVMVLPFLPATNLFFYVGFIIAERILYIPSIGFCFLVTNGLNLLLKFRKGHGKNINAVVGVLLVLYASKTYQRNFVWKDEESLYRSGLETSPAKSYGNLANILIQQNKLTEAEHAYRTALKCRSNMADTHYNLGILLQNQHRFDEAIECYKDAIRYRPRLAAAHLNLGVTLISMNKLQEALVVLRNASEISDHGLKDPLLHAKSLTSIRYNIGRALHELQKHEEAVKVFLDAINRMPESYEAHSMFNMLGQTYSRLEKHTEAEKWYKRALQKKPDHVPALMTIARHYHENNEIKAAEESIKKAIKLEPNRTDTYVMYASFFDDHKNYHKAISILKDAIKIDSSKPSLYTFLSSLYRELKGYKEATTYELKALAIAPKDVSILMNLGALYHIQGMLKEAESTYLQALKIDPHNNILLNNIKKLRRIINSKK